MRAIPIRAFVIAAASCGAFQPLAPAVLARPAAVLEDRTPAPPAFSFRPSCREQVVRPC